MKNRKNKNNGFVNLINAALEAAINTTIIMQEVRTEEAKEKATKAAADAYRETLEKELGLGSDDFRYSSTKTTKITFPAKYTETNSFTHKVTSCRIFVKPEWTDVIRTLNSNLFMRNFSELRVTWPVDADCFVIKTEEDFYGISIVVEIINDGHSTILTRERFDDRDRMKLREFMISRNVMNNGYIEI